MTTNTPIQDEIEALLNGPALAPPPGVEPNFENPPNHNGTGYGLISAMLAIAAIAMACRIYTKIIHPKRIRIEDAVQPIKLSQPLLWTCHIVLWINILFYSASAFAINLACIPRQRIWDKTITEGHCFNENDLYLAGTIVNLVSDIAIFATPQQVIWSLHMSFQKKVRVSCVFAIGLLCIGLACARISTTIENPKLPDSVYNLPKLAFLGAAEMVCALLVFCAPAFPQTMSNLGALPIFSQISLLVRGSTTTNNRSLTSSGKRSWIRRGGNSRKQSASRKEHKLEGLHKTTPEDEAAIIHTTEFEMRESYAARDSASRGGPVRTHGIRLVGRTGARQGTAVILTSMGTARSL
ncbi:hypothetical protein PG997_014609 [Apiospora hydei]|uniref:Rhodopsin domain-containing protein n=1 Tax=Apiospora hydei TaxID=1337664 RepID=A0ABR1UUZ1_9PEZI